MAYAHNLQKIIKDLGATSTRSLSPQRIVSLLKAANISKQHGAMGLHGVEDEGVGDEDYARTGRALEEGLGEHYHYEMELEWLLLSKATIQTYGIVLNSLVGQTLPLAQDMFYWDEVSSSHTYTALYSLQTAPHRVVRFSREIFTDAMRRLRELREMERIPVFPGPYHISTESLHLSSGDDHETWLEAPSKSDSLSQTARKFYALVKNSVHERSIRMGAMSPFSLARHEILKKQSAIKKLREMQASAIGVLIGEGLSFGLEEEQDHEEWKGIVERAVLLMENVVRNVSLVDHTLDEFEETVFHLEKPVDSTAPRAPIGITSGRVATSSLSRQLQDILTKHLPAQATTSRSLTATHGRPGLVTRYWLPAGVLLLSSTTIFRILINRQAELADWLSDFGSTIIDFWMNWVVEPTRKIVGTIRHSEDSEVALMSRRSLTADMESLERMVVDFAIDNPAMTPSGTATDPLSNAAIEMVRARVKEGDLTPVLKAYERDLRKPFRGAIKGELVRALLIQIQKTKVDVEVAISGIDRLLKSQELVFGFIGLTPGVLVCVGLYQWARSALGGRRGKRYWSRAGQMLRTMRNVDRILSRSGGIRGDNNGMLTYKEHGLLLCEVHVLREFARGVLPRGVGGEFVEDCEELVDVRKGVAAQIRVLARVRW